MLVKGFLGLKTMKRIYELLLGVVGVAAIARSTATRFVSGGQSRYGFRAIFLGQPLEPESAIYSQGSATDQQGVPSAGEHSPGNVSPQSVERGSFPIIAAAPGSLLQLRSESEADESGEPEGTEESSTSTSSAEPRGASEKPTTSESAQEAASEGEKETRATVKEPQNEVKSSEAESSKATGTEEGENAHDEETISIQPQVSQKTPTDSEKGAAEEHSQKPEHAESEVNKTVGTTEPLAGPPAGTAGGKGDEFDALIRRLQQLLKASKGKELYAKLSTMMDLHGNVLIATMTSLPSSVCWRKAAHC